MVHGLGGAATNWTDVMDLLRDRLDPVAPDLPGFGWSPPPRGRRLLAARRTPARVTELVEQVGRRPVHLLGNSLGGTVVDRRRRDPARPRAHPHAGVTRAAGAAAAADQRAPAGARGAVGRAAAGPAAGPLPGRAAGPRHHRALLGRPVAGPARAARGGDGRGRAAGPASSTTATR